MLLAGELQLKKLHRRQLNFGELECGVIVDHVVVTNREGLGDSD